LFFERQKRVSKECRGAGGCGGGVVFWVLWVCFCPTSKVTRARKNNKIHQSLRKIRGLIALSHRFVRRFLLIWHDTSEKARFSVIPY
jgi:hypothetical protein